jgi:hypothetical protein
MRAALIGGVTCLTLFASCAQTDPGHSVDAPVPGLPGCVEGCTVWDRKEFFHERGLDSCNVSARLHLSEAGEVTDVEIRRGGENSDCGRAMREWAFSTRWEPSSENPDRYFTVGEYFDPQEVASSEVRFRTYPIRTGGSVSHLLLIHPDPDVTVEAIQEEYGSGLGRVSLLSEAHTRRQTLCTAGRTSDGGIELQAVPVSDNPAVSGVTPEMGPVELARFFRRLHPDQQFLAGEVLEESGTCLLLQSLSGGEETS